MLLSLLLLALLPTQTPRALDADQMRAAMHTYFEGEQLSALPFVATGGTTIFAGSVMLALHKGPAVDGAAVPLIAVGAIEVAAGILFSASAGPRMTKLEALLAGDPNAFRATERARLDRIVKVFQPLLLGVEGALTIAGGTMAITGAVRNEELLTGVGIGLAIQGLAMFLLDWAVLDRAMPYRAALLAF